MKNLVICALSFFLASCSANHVVNESLPENIVYEPYQSGSAFYWVNPEAEINEDSKIILTPAELVVSIDYKGIPSPAVTSADEIVLFLDQKLQEVFTKAGLIESLTGENVNVLYVTAADVVPPITGEPKNIGVIEYGSVIRNSKTNQVIVITKSAKIKVVYDKKGYVSNMKEIKSETAKWADDLANIWKNAAVN